MNFQAEISGIRIPPVQSVSEPFPVRWNIAGVGESSGCILRETLTPGKHGGLEVALQGDLARILQLCEAGAGKSKRPGTDVPGRGLSVVAGGATPFVCCCLRPG